MTLDTSDVQSALSKIESDMRRLQADVAQLRRVVDTAEDSIESSANDNLAEIGLTLPQPVVVQRPGEIIQYLRAHPELTGLVGEIATALVEEFQGERSESELVLYQDPEIDDRQLTYYVRVPEYDASLMPRLDAIAERFDERFTHASELILITTDYDPLQ